MPEPEFAPYPLRWTADEEDLALVPNGVKQRFDIVRAGGIRITIYKSPMMNSRLNYIGACSGAPVNTS